MKQPIRILLFTLSACPIGRSMGTVLREVMQYLPEVELNTAFVDVQINLGLAERTKNPYSTRDLSYFCRIYLQGKHRKLAKNLADGVSERVRAESGYGRSVGKFLLTLWREA